MAETSKNKIYYNDNEDNIADVLADMKKLAESTDNAIEGAKYDDTELKKKNETQDEEIAEINKKDTTQDNLIEELQTKLEEVEAENVSLKNQIPSGEEVGNPIHLSDSSDMECEIVPIGASEQETREGYNLWNLGNKDNTSGDINFELESGNYTISFIKKRIANSTISNTWIYRYGYIKFYDTNNTLLSTISDKTAIELTANQTSERQNISFNAPENTAKMVINFSNNNGDNNKNTEVIDIQLIKGTEEKDYEQYGASPSPDYPSEIVTVGQNGSVEISVDNGLETTDTNYQSYTKVLPIQKEFVKIGDVEDTFVKIDGKWYEKHLFDKVFFDGTESIKESENAFSINKKLSAKSNFNWNIVVIVSNGFLGAAWNNFKKKENTITYHPYDLNIFVNAPKYTSDELKTLLKQKYEESEPIYATYLLSEPKLIPCTEEQESILNSFYTYKGITNVSMSGIGTLKVNYKKDLETIINKLSATSVAE